MNSKFYFQSYIIVIIDHFYYSYSLDQSSWEIEPTAHVKRKQLCKTTRILQTASQLPIKSVAYHSPYECKHSIPSKILIILLEMVSQVRMAKGRIILE